MTRENFVSIADVAVADPVRLISKAASYWAGFDVEVEAVDGRCRARLGDVTGVLEASRGGLTARLEAPDLGALEMMRSYLTDTLVTLAEGDAGDIAWRGAMALGRTLADFREARLVALRDVGPRMKRLTFAGEDLARFGSEADIHVRLYFPPVGCGTPEWPRPGPDGRIVWPAAERRPDVRYYTVRRWRPERGEIDIDFVMHDDMGPGCAFAARAVAGDVVGVSGPAGRGVPRSGHVLIAGDETALPSIARALEGMARDARGAAFIEVDGPQDETPLDGPPGVSVTWLHRRGAAAGTTGLLLEAVTSAYLPPSPDVFVWAACEYSDAQAIRRHLKTKCGMARDRYLVVGFWQRESAEAKAA